MRTRPTFPENAGIGAPASGVRIDVQWSVTGLVRALVCLSAMLAFATRAHADGLALPHRGDDASEFAPAGWAIEHTFDADLDMDGVNDRVLVLLQSEPTDGSDRERALVVLLRRRDAFELGGSNDSLLMCFECGGAKGGDGSPELSFERGALLVSQLSGSRWFSTALDRFRWSRTRKRFELIGEDVANYDSATGEASETSCNMLTRECVETRTPPQVDPEGNPREAPARVRRFRATKGPLLSLERTKSPLG